jgi:peptide/nickel transport system permease protein
MGILKFIGTRIITIIISTVIVIIITNVLMHLAPGDFFDFQRFFQTSTERSAMNAENQTMLRKKFEEKYGLDKPVWVQVLNYLKDAAVFKFGPSFSNPSRNIEDLIAERFPVTLTLTLLSIAIAIVVGIPLGIIAALKKNTWIDYLAMSISMIGQVIPAYVFAVLLVLIFSIFVYWLPTSGWDGPRYMVLPAITLALGPISGIARYMRSSLIEILDRDYIRTAYAKGGTERKVILGHALKNSLIPIVTVLGPQMAFLLVGTVWIEVLFRIPGMGQLFVNAATQRDNPLLITSTFILALTVMVMNLIVDIIYAVLDPRIKLQ